MVGIEMSVEEKNKEVAEGIVMTDSPEGASAPQADEADQADAEKGKKGKKC